MVTLCILTNIITLVVFVLLHIRLKREHGKMASRVKEDYAQTIQHLLSVVEEIYNRLSKDIRDLEARTGGDTAPGPAASDFNTLDKRHHVISLAERGLNLDEITKKLHIPEGEAELIINLRRYERGRKKM